MQTSQYLRSTRLSTTSSSSPITPTTTTTPNSLLNGLIPTHRLSQTSSTLTPNHSPNQIRILNNPNNQLKRSEKIKYFFLIIFLTFIFAFLFLTTIQLSTIIVKYKKISLSNLTFINNQTENDENEEEKYFPIKSFFACVWFFNLLLFIICLFIHGFLYKRNCQHNRTRTAFLREFGRIFDDGKSSSTNTLVDYLIKTCLLCILWYLSCYLMFRSMSILVSSQIIILYSITITLRQVLGWIFLHEQFIGNKIIAHILGLSGLLFLAHNDGFRFNQFLLGLTMLTCSVAIKTIFDILINGFVKDLTSSKLRIVMTNVCLCGTCLLWPFVLLFHVTTIEIIRTFHFYSLIFLLTLISALALNVLLISIPIKYSSISNPASLLLVIPAVTLIDYYLFNVKYTPLVISAILCSFLSVLLSIIPKQCFQGTETTKMKQALGLINKDSNGNNNLGPMVTGGITSSAFQEIRAQRRIRDALLYNEMKT